MLPFAGFLGLLLFAFSIWAFIDLSLTNKDDVRVLWKPVWWVALILAGPAGSIAWTVFGRPKNGGLTPGGRRSKPTSADGSEPTDENASVAEGYTPAPRGPEDSPEWADFIANNSPTDSTDVLTAKHDPETSADFSDWEAEFDDPSAEDSTD